MFKDCSAESLDLVIEFVYESIETACGVRFSVSGFVDLTFIFNCMRLATALRSATEVDNKKFSTFVIEVLLNQIYENEDSKLFVLDTLCILCQDLKSVLQASPSKSDQSE